MTDKEAMEKYPKLMKMRKGELISIIKILDMKLYDLRCLQENKKEENENGSG